MDNYTIATSRVRLARNLADMRFPSCAGREEAEQVAAVAVQAANAVTDGNFHVISELSKGEREYLVERRLISPALVSAPYGSVFISKDKQLSVMIMEEDHIRAQSFDRGLSLSRCFEAVKEYDLALRAKARLTYDKQLGYLTACPTNVGTGMRASVMMFLPGITYLGRINELEEELKKANLTIRGALGEGSKGEGFLYQISNGVSLGVSEETILNRVGSAAERIAKIESDMIRAYYERDRIRTEDAVYRSIATLGAARVLSQKELESCLVYSKIGVSLGLIEPLSVDPDELLVMSQPYGIVRLTGCGDTPLARDAARADFIRNILSKKQED